MAARASAAVVRPEERPAAWVKPDERTVRVSVVVPVYGREPLSPDWVEAMVRELHEQGAELLVVDNGPQPWSSRPELPAPIRVLRCATPGAYAARNEGVRHAAGQWLVFADSDCVPRPAWLSGLVGRAPPGKELRAGAVRVYSPNPKPNGWERYDLVRGFPQERYVQRGYAATANLAVPAAVVRALSGFDERRFSGGDADLCRRALALGYRLVFVPEAVVDHPARDTWQALVTKARRLKGGQLRSGPYRRRALWWVRTFLPPAMAWRRFLAQRDRPWRDRLLACGVQVGLWGVEMAEAVRLLLGGVPERR